MKVVYSERHRAHDPKFVLVRGVVKQTNEQPERADRLLSGLRSGNHELIEPTEFGDGPRARVHSQDYLRFMAEAWEAWNSLGDAGAEMVANVHPVRNQSTYPEHIVGRLGWHSYDTSCPISAGTFEAACAATDVAATASQLLLDGARSAYGLCRPPGHHAFRDMAGGFCFFNNSAVAAAHLLQRYERVAILDVDVHHGNGTQAIFYESADVFTVSIHADPAGFYPFFTGYAHEKGAGPGSGANLNLPLPFGVEDEGYLRTLDVAKKAILEFSPGALVVALGLDASKEDPYAALSVSTDGFRRIGDCIASLGYPTVFIQEGGYLSPVLGKNLAAVLAGFE